MYIVTHTSVKDTEHFHQPRKFPCVPSQSITVLPPSRVGLEFGRVGFGMCENRKMTQVERTWMAPSPAKSWSQVTLGDAQALVNKLEWMPFSLPFVPLWVLFFMGQGMEQWSREESSQRSSGAKSLMGETVTIRCNKYWMLHCTRVSTITGKKWKMRWNNTKVSQEYVVCVWERDRGGSEKGRG